VADSAVFTAPEPEIMVVDKATDTSLSIAEEHTTTDSIGAGGQLVNKLLVTVRGCSVTCMLFKAQTNVLLLALVITFNKYCISELRILDS
jgi:hypothetical protein